MDAYVYVWEFIVDREQVEEFERHYGEDGSWVRLFRQAPGYLQTLLLRDSVHPGRFVTIDRWESDVAYREFRTRFSQQYADLDGICEKLTRRETLLGEFTEP